MFSGDTTPRQLWDLNHVNVVPLLRWIYWSFLHFKRIFYPHPLTLYNGSRLPGSHRAYSENCWLTRCSGNSREDVTWCLCREGSQQTHQVMSESQRLENEAHLMCATRKQTWKALRSRATALSKEVIGSDLHFRFLGSFVRPIFMELLGCARPWGEQ